MASVIKNQLVKHLSKFAKNLSPDKIQLSTLKGEGELKGLELNEDVLMEILELPTWLRLRRAVCNRVNIKIQFSKLKSQPLRLYLDEVLVDMETCDELRQPGSAGGLPSYSSGGRYSFGDRVVDGMYLHINSVVVSFTSRAFKAELQISRIIVQSKTPTWREATDLRHTRISEKHRDLLLTFKEVEWQTIRLEANCMVQESRAAVSAPLRFIANQAKVRISIKKRYSGLEPTTSVTKDCSVVASKVQLLMDDLLWVLTDSQMKAAFVFVKHLKGNIDKAADQTKQLADRLLQKERQSQAAKPALASPNTVLFNKFDIQESSFHFQSSRIDFHVCDDINSVDPNRKRQVDGGALGIALMKLCIDHYPIRAAGSSRQHWPGYDDSMAKRDIWAQRLLGAYGDVLKRHQQQQQKQARAPRGAGVGAPAAAAASSGAPTTTAAGAAGSGAYSNLIERSIVVRLEDLFVTSVSLERLDERRPKKLLSSDKKALLLPKDMSTVHFEYTEYFFAKDAGSPVPPPNVFILVNPIVLTVDVMTILWLNSFALSLLRDVEAIVQELSVHEETKESNAAAAAAAPLVKLEMLMPKVVLPAFFRQPSPAAAQPQPGFGGAPTSAYAGQPTRTADGGGGGSPTALQLQISLLIITNAFSSDAPADSVASAGQRPKRDATDGVLPRPDGAAELAASYGDLHLVARSGGFPCGPADALLLRRELWDCIVGEARSASAPASLSSAQPPSGGARLWLLSVDQAWLEFTVGVPGSAGGRPASFVESVPLAVWMCVPPPPLGLPPLDEAAGSVEPETRHRVDILVKVGAKICAQLSPAQCDFMLKLSDSLQTLKDDLKEELDAYASSSLTVRRARALSDVVAVRAAPPPSPQQPAVVTLLLHVAEVEFAAVMLTADHEPGSAALQPPTVLPSSSSSSACLNGSGDDAASASARDVASARDGRSACSSPPTARDQASRVSLIVGSYAGDAAPTTNDDGSSGLAWPGNLSHGESSWPKAAVAGTDSDSGAFTQSSLSSSHDYMAFAGDAGSRVDGLQRVQPPEPTAAVTAFTPSSSLSGQPTRDGRRPSSAVASLAPLAQAQVKVASSFAKFTSRVKAAAKTATGGDEDEESVISDWDSLSVKSDDEGDFLFLNLDEEAPAFATGNQAGFIAEDASASDLDSVCSERQKRLVAVVSLKICNIECGMELKGNDAVVKFAVNHFIASDLGSLPYDDFLNRHMAAQCVLEPVQVLLPSLAAGHRPAPPVLVRLLAGSGIEHPQMGPLEDGFASIAIADYAFAIDQSTVDRLSSFAAALQTGGLSSKTPPKPLCIDLCNVTATIRDDAETPSSAPSKNAKPVVVHLSKVNVTRTLDGTISIHGDTVARPWPVQIRQDQRTQAAAAASKSHDFATMTETSGALQADARMPKDTPTKTDGRAPPSSRCADATAAARSDFGSPGGSESPAQQLLLEMHFLRGENDDLRARLGARESELAALRERLDDASAASAASTSASTSGDGHGAPSGSCVSGESPEPPQQRQVVEEAADGGWRRRLLESEAEADEARAERDCLLKTVRLLQDELTESERRANAARAEAEATWTGRGRGKAAVHKP